MAALCLLAPCAAAAERALPDLTGYPGGLVVHLGRAGDEGLAALARLGMQDSWTVQLLVRDDEEVRRVRARLRARGTVGPVSVRAFNGAALPFVSDLANHVICSGPAAVPRAEILRVLAPRGKTYLPRGRGWEAVVKPVPDDIDDWPMHLYAPDNNAVSRDRVVGPPRRSQWRSGPRWTRSHEFMSSLTAMVSMDGRLFHVMDEGSRVSPLLPAKWRLVAQDAFNGAVLWKRDLPSWHTHLWPVKSGPAQLQRRLVATGDAVYLPLGVGAPVSALDPRTGRTIRTFEGSDGVEEILISRGVMFLVAGDTAAEQQGFSLGNTKVWGAAGDATGEFAWDDRARQVMALDLETGRILWERAHAVVPVTLAVDGDRVYFHDGRGVVALDRSDGRRQWSSRPVELKKYKLGTATAPSLVLHEDVVLCTTGFDFKPGVITALSAETGKTLWAAEQPASGHSSQDDLHVIDGLVWSGGIARILKQGGTYTGRDPRTGEVRRTFPLDVKHNSWFHQRCYRSRATERFLMPAATGTEYVDIRAGHWETHHWLRGACVVGVLPANGMTYGTPHPCACFMESLVRGFNALKTDAAAAPLVEVEPERRLVKGPAYAMASAGARRPAGAWPMYRHDVARSGYTQYPVPAELEERWRVTPGGRITPPVVAGGKVFVAAIDRQTLHALDEGTGEAAWSFTSGGRIDSPPTVWRGRVLFGSADGWLYCLRAADGALAWRRLVAPADRQMMNDGRIESVWPVHGSVIVVNDVIYCLAGRSIFLDGGMRLALVDPLTGTASAVRVLDDRDPVTGKSMQLFNSGLKMAPANSDLLSSDGTHLYLKAQRMDLTGKRIFPAGTRKKRVLSLSDGDQEPEGTHLFSGAGFLDDDWHHRSYWLFGRSAGSGWGGWMKPGKYVPAGRILVVRDDSTVFGFGREPAFFCQSHVLEYQLFRARGRRYKRDEWRKPFESIKNKEADITDWKQNRKLPVEKLSVVKYDWRVVNPPLLVRAMAGAGDTLFIAGPPDVIDETKLHGRFGEPGVVAGLARQQAALDGEMGGLLRAVSGEDGATLAEYDLASPPVFDGIAAADGRLFLSAIDGTVTCYSGRLPERLPAR
jgi:outer membrane protein assembly factor BamB